MVPHCTPFFFFSIILFYWMEADRSRIRGSSSFTPNSIKEDLIFLLTDPRGLRFKSNTSGRCFLGREKGSHGLQRVLPDILLDKVATFIFHCIPITWHMMGVRSSLSKTNLSLVVTSVDGVVMGS